MQALPLRECQTVRRSKPVRRSTHGMRASRMTCSSALPKSTTNSPRTIAIDFSPYVRLLSCLCKRLSGLDSDAEGNGCPSLCNLVAQPRLCNLIAQPVYESASRAGLDRGLAATNLSIIVGLGLGRRQGTEAPICALGVHNDGGRG